MPLQGITNAKTVIRIYYHNFILFLQPHIYSLANS